MPQNIHHIGAYAGRELDIAVREVSDGFQIAYMTVKRSASDPPFLIATRSPAATYLTLDGAFDAGRKFILQSIDTNQV